MPLMDILMPLIYAVLILAVVVMVIAMFSGTDGLALYLENLGVIPR